MNKIVYGINPFTNNKINVENWIHSNKNNIVLFGIFSEPILYSKDYLKNINLFKSNKTTHEYHLFFASNNIISKKIANLILHSNKKFFTFNKINTINATFKLNHSTDKKNMSPQDQFLYKFVYFLFNHKFSQSKISTFSNGLFKKINHYLNHNNNDNLILDKIIYSIDNFFIFSPSSNNNTILYKYDFKTNIIDDMNILHLGFQKEFLYVTTDPNLAKHHKNYCVILHLDNGIPLIHINNHDILLPRGLFTEFLHKDNNHNFIEYHIRLFLPNILIEKYKKKYTSYDNYNVINI